MSHRDYIDASHGGEGWSPRVRSTQEERQVLLGNFGQDTEYGRLQEVVLHAPCPAAFDAAIAPTSYHFDEKWHLDRAKDEHDQFARILSEHGVVVHHLCPSVPTPNHTYVRDLFTMSPLGAIVSRMAATVRAGEEMDAARFLSEKRIPIVKQVLGSGVFEGPDLIFVRPGLAFVATSVRSNVSGAAQVTAALKEQGVEVIPIQTTYGCGHLDGVLSIVSSGLALVIPKLVSFTAVDALRNCGYELIELTDASEISRMAINVLTLNREVVLVPSDCPGTARLIEAHGVKCIPIEVSELRKGGGSLHCMTGVLSRSQRD